MGDISRHLSDRDRFFLTVARCRRMLGATVRSVVSAGSSLDGSQRSTGEATELADGGDGDGGYDGRRSLVHDDCRRRCSATTTTTGDQTFGGRQRRVRRWLEVDNDHDHDDDDDNGSSVPLLTLVLTATRIIILVSRLSPLVCCLVPRDRDRAIERSSVARQLTARTRRRATTHEGELRKRRGGRTWSAIAYWAQVRRTAA